MIRLKSAGELAFDDMIGWIVSVLVWLIKTWEWLWQKILRPAGGWYLWFVIGMAIVVFMIFIAVWCCLAFSSAILVESIQKARVAKGKRFAVFVETFKELLAEIKRFITGEVYEFEASE